MLYNLYNIYIIFALYNNYIFDDNIIIIIFNFMKYKYILKKFIDIDLLDWDNLSLNENSIDFFKNDKYINKINIQNLCNNKNKDICDIIYKLIWEYGYDINIFLKKNSLNNKLLMNNPNSIDFLVTNIKKINWIQLSYNKNAIKILEKYKKNICWDNLSLNENSINLFKNNIDKINLNNLLLNPNINNFINKLNINLDDYYDYTDPNLEYKLDWRLISEKCKNINFLKKNYNYINWSRISSNIEAISLIEERLLFESNLSEDEYDNMFYDNKISWNRLSNNINAINILEKYIHKINYNQLALNENAIPLLKIYINNNKNINIIFWENLALNKNAINLLKKYIEYNNKKNIKFSFKFWENISLNPSIFEYK